MQNYCNMNLSCQNQRQNSRTTAASDNKPIAMAYVPWQKWRNIYDAEKGFRRGTIFQELDLPFRGIGGCQK